VYWAITAMMILAGGFIAWVYFGDRSEGVIALHVGLSTPLILQKLVTSVPEPKGSQEHHRYASSYGSSLLFVVNGAIARRHPCWNRCVPLQ
jgi:hypothetical protein